jgi:tetratricopeptide (TPR) repeat protein
MRMLFILSFSLLLVPVAVRAQDTDWFQKGLEANDPKEQLEYFTKSIVQGNDTEAAYFCRASTKLRLGDVQGAIDDYSSCIRINPDDAGAYYNRGIAKEQLSVNYRDAVADISTAYSIDPSNASYINKISELYIKMEDYPGAITFYESVLKLYPENASVYDNLGYCYLALENYANALEDFNKAVALQPKQVDAMLGIALVYYYKRDLEKAKEYLGHAKEVKPILFEGAAGFESFRKEGLIYNDRDSSALIWMLEKWK